jgi:IS5 family transposase
VKLRVLDIARAARSKAKQGQEKLKRAYGQLLNSTGRVAGQAKRFSQEIAAGVKRSADVVRKQLAQSSSLRQSVYGCNRSGDG